MHKLYMSRSTTKPTKWLRPVWSESSLSAWRKLGSLATHLAHSEDSDQTGRMPRLIWVFAGRTVILLICRNSESRGSAAVKKYRKNPKNSITRKKKLL